MATSIIKVKNPYASGNIRIYNFELPIGQSATISGDGFRGFLITNAISSPPQGMYILGKNSTGTIHGLTDVKSSTVISITYSDGEFIVTNNSSNALVYCMLFTSALQTITVS